MKKISRILCLLACAAAVLFSLFGCADAGAPDHKLSDPSSYAVSVSSAEQKLDAFMQGRSDRTSFTDAEKDAAEYLRDTLVSYGYVDPAQSDGDDLPSMPDDEKPVGMIRNFYVKDNENGIKLESRNVVAVYGDAESDKNVVIGASYDNFYSTPYIESKRKGDRSAGALESGTGTAALLAIAEYLQVRKPSLDFTVTLAFFGASSRDGYGASAFYEDMTAKEKTGTVLMIELQRLGVDHVYAFSDARETKREPFFDGIARKNGLDIYKPTQKSAVITDASVLNGVPYYQWAMQGNFGVFFNHNIPTLNLIGANWETIDLTDRESADCDNVLYTENDTLANIKRNYPDYGEKIASAATLVVKSLEDGAFIETMEYDRANFPDTDALGKDWIWYLVVLGIAIIVGATMSFITARLAKKYPIVPPTPPKMKMAVFGMDYEDKNSADIFVDIKQPEPFDDIFPGVPNNDPPVSVDPSGVFGAPPVQAEKAQEQASPEQPTEEQPTEKTVEPEQPEETSKQPTARSAERSDEKPVETGENEQKPTRKKRTPAAEKPPKPSDGDRAEHKDE